MPKAPTTNLIILASGFGIGALVVLLGVVFVLGIGV